MTLIQAIKEQETMPFASLLQQQQARVSALADALFFEDCLPLVRFLGAQAPQFYQYLSVAAPIRHGLLSDFWTVFRRVPRLSQFVIQGESHA